MNIQHRTMIFYTLVGCALGTTLAVALLPGWLPTLVASITGRTVYWLLARVGGFVAYGLLWLSVVFGLLLTSKVARAWPGVRHANNIHQSVSLLALGYTFFHALILLADHMSGFDVGAVLFPFTATYRPLAVGLGQLGLYVLIIVMVSYYVRSRIGVKTWRVLHYLTFILYYLVTAHGVLAGTDSQTPWALVLYASTGLLVYALTVFRVLTAVKPVSKETHDLTSYPTAGHYPVG
jgi:predicted ferric reductase